MYVLLPYRHMYQLSNYLFSLSPLATYLDSSVTNPNRFAFCGFKDWLIVRAWCPLMFFTNYSQIWIARDEDGTLEEGAMLTVVDIVDLLEFC